MAVENLLIDTSIIIEHLRKKVKNRSQFYKLVGSHRLFMSSVTLFELFAGATNQRKKQDINDIVDYLEILPFTEQIAERAGEIFIHLKNENRLIEVRDLFIAATALAHEMPVVTLNTKHFERVDGLCIM